MLYKSILIPVKKHYFIQFEKQINEINFFLAKSQIEFWFLLKLITHTCDKTQSSA